MKNSTLLLMVLVALLNSACSNGSQATRDPESTSEGMNGLAKLGYPSSLAQVAFEKKFLWNIACSNDCADPVLQIDEELIKVGGLEIFYASWGHYPRIEPGIDGDRYLWGGIPQTLVDDSISWSAHLASIDSTLDSRIPLEWRGYGVIDYERWPALWGDPNGRLSTYSLPDAYKEASVQFAKHKNPGLSDKAASDSARLQFNRAAKKFLRGTLRHVKSARPNVKWGFFAYPGRITWRRANIDSVQAQNESIAWLFEESDALFPDVYVGFKAAGTNLTDSLVYELNRHLIESTVNESVRLANGKPVLAYTWYRYLPRASIGDPGGQFLAASDAELQFEVPLQAGADAVVLWGGIDDSSGPRLDSLRLYFDEVVLPIIRKSR